jgi:hypothetical protein
VNFIEQLRRVLAPERSGDDNHPPAGRHGGKVPAVGRRGRDGELL